MFFLQRLGPVHSFIAAMSISIVIHLGDDILIMELENASLLVRCMMKALS
jgi:hypothetical protein